MVLLIGLLLVSVARAQDTSGPKAVQLTVVEWVATGVELLAVTVLVIGIGWSTALYVFRISRRPNQGLVPYDLYKRQVGRTLLLTLELLVASDILITVIFTPSFEHVAILGVLVLIRTFLSWSLGVEIEGRWPWQPRTPDAPKD